MRRHEKSEFNKLIFDSRNLQYEGCEKIKEDYYRFRCVYNFMGKTCNKKFTKLKYFTTHYSRHRSKSFNLKNFDTETKALDRMVKDGQVDKIDEKKYKCTDCNEMFEKARIVAHVQMLIYKYKCDFVYSDGTICDRTFNEKHPLKCH